MTPTAARKQSRKQSEGARSRGTPSPAPRRADGAKGTVTGRGGVVILFALSLVGALAAQWMDLSTAAGLGFVAGCVLAALTTRRTDLLTLVVSPPLVFLLAAVTAQVLTSLGRDAMARVVLVGLFTTLSAVAPWLFLGTALTVVVAVPRGLPAAVRDLRERLAGSRILQEDEEQDPVRWEETPRPRRGEAD
ncbi:DUF6542 domain-containing protein [Thermomonospora catenispora]|uniref:DUF6542 domain-containing protein n=1 Tax=Thermomonospora catenispora TaxID=2493090 RepID=UPI001589F5E9|nr:DUF6542 domain-containing protein [Thermomonospora catenispora]